MTSDGPAADVMLKTGARAAIRPARRTDRGRLAAFYGALQPDTVYQRFCSPRVPPEWINALASDPSDGRVEVLAEHGAELVGVSEAFPEEDGLTFEIALVVREDWQNQGLGMLLLGAVLEVAERRGAARFRACVLAQNVRMLHIVRRLTRPVRQQHTRGVCDLIVVRREHDGPAES